MEIKFDTDIWIKEMNNNNNSRAFHGSNVIVIFFKSYDDNCLFECKLLFELL